MKQIIFAMTLVLCLVGCKSKQQTPVENSGETEAVDEQFHVGEGAPAFSLTTLDGKPFNFPGDLKGKVTLLNFWATWCPPCVAEMPALERLSQLLKDEGVQVVAVSVDPAGSLEPVKQFVSDRGITFNILLDGSFSQPQRYGISGFPESFFVDANGKFLSVKDPETGKNVIRMLSDRPWDSKLYLDFVRKLAAAQQ